MEVKNICKNDIKNILNMWYENFEKKYWVTKETFKHKVFDDVDFYEEGSFVLKEDDKTIGIIITKINRRHIPEYNKTTCLSVILIDKKYQGNGYGKMLFKKAENELRKIGIEKILIGGDILNFFSGIPEPDEKKERFFQKLGFELLGYHYDLIADISQIDLDKLNISVNNEKAYIIREMIRNDKENLNKFFGKNFPGRWKAEINEYLDRYGVYENIILLWDNDSIIGFCKIGLGENNTGFLGPIGVDKDYRGYKLGNRLLIDSLKYLKQRGVHDVIIDWTI